MKVEPTSVRSWLLATVFSAIAAAASAQTDRVPSVKTLQTPGGVTFGLDQNGHESM